MLFHEFLGPIDLKSKGFVAILLNTNFALQQIQKLTIHCPSKSSPNIISNDARGGTAQGEGCLKRPKALTA